MPMVGVDRRSFLKTMGSAGFSTALPASALAGSPFAGGVVEEIAQPAQVGEANTGYSARFSVAGMSHDHIYGMVDAMIRGGGVLVSVHAAEPERGTAFLKRYPQAKAAGSEDEILNDSTIQLVLSSTIPNQRAPLGIRVMQHGKDYLSDKPGVTTLEQLADVRKTIAETKKIFAIMYSERLEVKAAVKAGELVQAGAIGKVIQTINIAPHQIYQATGDAGGGSGRPEWFWDPDRYRLAPGRSVSVLHGINQRGGSRFAGSEPEAQGSPQVSGFWGHDASRKRGLRLCAARLVHAPRIGNVGRRTALYFRY